MKVETPEEAYGLAADKVEKRMKHSLDRARIHGIPDGDVVRYFKGEVARLVEDLREIAKGQASDGSTGGSSSGSSG